MISKHRLKYAFPAAPIFSLNGTPTMREPPIAEEAPEYSWATELAVMKLTG